MHYLTSPVGLLKVESRPVLSEEGKGHVASRAGTGYGTGPGAVGRTDPGSRSPVLQSFYPFTPRSRIANPSFSVFLRGFLIVTVIF